MKKNVLIFVHTEYHLLLAINQIVKYYSDVTLFDVKLFIRKRKNSKRLIQPLDFSDLPISFDYFDEDVTSNSPLQETAKTAIKILLKINPSIFIFFQEQDPLMVILSNHFYKNGTEVFLLQDGLKPYSHLRYHSFGLLKQEHKQNIWMRNNGFIVQSWFSPLFSKKYAYLKGISKLFLTFPEIYDNWNRKPLEKIEFLALETLNPIYKKIFRWDNSLLPESRNIIFYMNQPMHDDGKAETRILKELEQKFPDTLIYVKLHPLTDVINIEQFKTLKRVKLINSPLPAELFIMNLKESLVLSVNSTSMFLNNPECKFFYLYKIFKNDIKRLSRWIVKQNPAKHVNVISNIEEISF